MENRLEAVDRLRAIHPSNHAGVVGNAAGIAGTGTGDPDQHIIFWAGRHPQHSFSVPGRRELRGHCP